MGNKFDDMREARSTMNAADDTRAWVMPAIGEGYAVEDDPAGRLRFFIGEELEIVWRKGIWVAHSCDEVEDRVYSSLKDAIPFESWLLENDNVCL